MRVLDLIDLRMEQYRAFQAVIAQGCAARGVCYARGAWEEAGDDDVCLLPPYGAAPDALRNGEWAPRATLLMIDLKGPMGTDAALMVAARSRGEVRYLSPMCGQAWCAGRFTAFRGSRVRCHPLAFFPSGRQLEVAGLLGAFDGPPEWAGGDTLGFAGAVWGRRKLWLDALRRAYGSKVDLRDGLAPADYRAWLGGVRVGLDIEGNQANTYRFAEIFLAGPACLAERRPFFVLGRPPVECEEIVSFANEDELLSGAGRLFADAARAQAIAAAGARWYRRTHHPRAHVAWLLDVAWGSAPTYDPGSPGPWTDEGPWSLSA